MAEKNVNLAGILADPLAASAFFASVLRNFLASRGKADVAAAVVLLVWKDGKVTIKAANRAAASELSLLSGEIGEAFSASAANVGYRLPVRVAVR
jgi:hypothetical protein